MHYSNTLKDLQELGLEVTQSLAGVGPRNCAVGRHDSESLGRAGGQHCWPGSPLPHPRRSIRGAGTPGTGEGLSSPCGQTSFCGCLVCKWNGLGGAEMACDLNPSDFG